MTIELGSKIVVKAFELDYNGNAVARHDNLIIFINGLLKDEEALVEITKISKSFANAKVIELIKQSKDRKTQQSNLGALNLYHLTNEEQLNWQIETTINTFEKISDIKLNYNDNIIHDNNFYQYRNKNVFHILDEDILQLGLYDLDNNLVKLNKFILAPRIVNNLIEAINNYNLNLGELKGNLKHLVFRNNIYGEVMITIVLKEEGNINSLIEYLINFKDVKSIYLNISPNNRHILGRKSQLIYGSKFLQEEVLNLKLPFDDKSFLQVNTNIAELVYKKIGQYVSDAKTVIDAYSGVGGIGLSLADKASKVYLLETNDASVRISKNIIKGNNLKNVKVIAGDVLESIDELNREVLIVDPPRNGLNKYFINKVLEKDFETIIYLSCDIKTQARDYNLLKEHYEILEFYPIKMFYQTTSIENLIILKRK